VKTLFADLTHAAQDDVFDGCGIDAAVLDQRIQNLSSHVGRVPTGQFPASTAASGPQRLNDIGFRHKV
jgi:hypothetical protein